MDEGRAHVNVVASLYHKLMLKNKHVLHEHPTTGLAWKEDTVVALVKSPPVHATVAYPCMYGLSAPAGGSPGTRLPAMKPARSITGSVYMKDQLPMRCHKIHSRQPLIGGRCHDAAFCPLPLVEAILKGIPYTADSDAKRATSLIGCLAMEERRAKVLNAVTHAAGTIPVDPDDLQNSTSSVKRASDGELPIADPHQRIQARLTSTRRNARRKTLTQKNAR